MKIKHYILQKTNGLAWYGGIRLENAWKGEPKYKQVEKSLNERGIISERQFEVDCFLSLMEDCQSVEFVLFEIGAGWGHWSMAANGVIENRIVKTNAKKCKCIAVEALPAHAEICRQHFELNKVSGSVIPCAVSGKKGNVRFNTCFPDTYGQSLSFGGGNKLFGLFNLIRGSTITVESISLNDIVQRYGKATLIHIDVQGEETEIIESVNGVVSDYFMIGTHSVRHNKAIAQKMVSDYDCILDVMPKSMNEIDGIGRVQMLDGMQIWKARKC